MYKGKKTLFYNGEILCENFDEFLLYNKDERNSWQVIIVLPGVEVVSHGTFSSCRKVEAVIMSDSVRRIEEHAFFGCWGLEYIPLSRNLEYIGESAFAWCESLTSIFIPPSCRETALGVFQSCTKLIIFHVPQHIQLGDFVIGETTLIRASPIAIGNDGDYYNDEEVNEWIKNRHADNEFSLHRACTSYNPLDEVIFDIVKRQGLKAFKKSDSVGVTPSKYLSENPYTEIKEQQIIKRYILEMMGEII